jgi:hypothetical protein
VKNRFQNLPFKCNLQRYTSCLLVINPAINFAAFDRLKLMYNKSFKSPKGVGGARARLTSVEAAAMSLAPLEAFLLGAVSKAGLYKLNPVDI